MAFNIGLDFGSTNSLVSRFDYNSGRPLQMHLIGSTDFIPSVVAFDNGGNGEIEFGSAAKICVGYDYRVLDGFKMLLTADEDEWEYHDYDSVYSPYRATKEFLNKILGQVLKSTPGEITKIDKLTIGIPVVWRNSISDIDGSAIIKKICDESEYVNEVQFVTEPDAASAYFAYKLMKEENKSFNGYFLLIDYGGGTLDITLSKIDTKKNDDNESDNSIYIEYMWSTGAGESKNGRIGEAALAYQEAVILQALKDEGKLREGETYYNSESIKYSEFSVYVQNLEYRLIEKAAAIEKYFQERFEENENTIWERVKDFQDDIAFFLLGRINQEPFKLPISYGLLVKVYMDEIYHILQTAIDEMKQYMTEKQIDFTNGNTENFHLQLVGGFGKYYLVKQQVREAFASENLGEHGFDVDADAISLGTSLYANGIITLKYRAPYSIGICSESTDKSIVYDYAIKYEQEIIFNEIYWVTRKTDDKEVVFSSPRVEYLLVNNQFSEEYAEMYSLKHEYIAQLPEDSSDITKGYHIGFSLDSKRILSLYICEYDRIGRKRLGEIKRIELSKCDEMFSELLKSESQ